MFGVFFYFYFAAILYKGNITGWEKQCGYTEDKDLTQASRMTRRRGREAPYKIKYSSGKQHQAETRVPSISEHFSN